MDTLFATESLTSRLPSRLLSLPQELIDMIFAFAYPKVDSDIGIAFKDEWEEQQDDFERCGLHFLLEPFPEPKVAEWLVSKAFFVCAARAYMEAQEGPAWDYAAIDFLKQKNGLFCQYAQTIAVGSVSRLSGLRWCQRLRVLQLSIDVGDDFSAIEDKKPWVDEFEAADLEKLVVTREIRGLELSLKSFSLEAEECCFSKPEVRSTRLTENVKALEQFLWPDVRSPKLDLGMETDSSGPERAMPLYLGSRVCDRGPELLPERPAWNSSSDLMPAARQVTDGDGTGQVKESGSKAGGEVYERMPKGTTGD